MERSSSTAILVNNEILENDNNTQNFNQQQNENINDERNDYEENQYQQNDEEYNFQDNDQDASDDASIIRYNSENEPEDKYNFNYIIFYLLGMTTLLPWNFFMNAEDYWLYKFRNVTYCNSTVLTPIQKSFTSDLSISASIPGTIFLIINAIFGHLISLQLKMIGSMFIILILFIITTIFSEINTDNWQDVFFVITILIVIVMNSFSAILSGGLFGIVGLFPSEYMTAVVSGQALGGIFTSLAMIISLTFGMNAQITALVFFNVGNLVLIISIVTFAIMFKTKFFRYYVMQEHKSNKNNITNSDSMTTLTENLDTLQAADFMIVMKKIYLYAFSEFSVFAITLCVYPSVTVLIRSKYRGNGHLWNDIYFMPVANYLIFNSGDYLGRILAGAFEQPKNKPWVIVIFNLLRIAFVPFLMMSNLYPHNYLPVIVSSDIMFICLIAGFAVTNGYIANISMIMAPKVVMHHEKELASSIMAACLGLGLTLGSAISLILVQVI